MVNYSYTVRVLRVDGSKEFSSNKLKSLYKDKGIDLKVIAPYIPK